jgi:O-antigen ligase
MYAEQGEFSALRFAVTGIGAYIILFLNGFSIGPVGKKGSWFLYFWFAFSLVSLISAILNHDGILGEIWQMIGVPLAFFLGFPRLAERSGSEILAWGLILGFFSYVCISLGRYPLVPTYYKGVFFNANTMGMVLVSILAGGFAVLRGWIGKKEKFWCNRLKISLMIFFNLCIALLLIATSSRTSFLILTALFLIFIWTLLLDAKEHRGWIMALLGLAFLAIMGLVLLVIQDSGVALFQNLIEKFSSNPDNTALSGREYIWQEVFQEASILGHGNMYFTNTVGRLPHNAYIAVLGMKGIPAVLLLLLMHFMVLVWALQKMIRGIKNDAYAATPLFIVIAYLMIGMTENVGGILGNGLHVAFLIAIGLLIRETGEDSGSP